MSRTTDALQEWTAPDDDQERLRRQFLVHARQFENGDDRRCLPDHVTASALVVTDALDAVLLGHHRKVGLWLQFGGHVEPIDHSLIETALREAAEESGLSDLQLRWPQPTRLDVHPAPCSPQARHHLDVQYTAIVPGRPEPRVSHESFAVRWFELNDLPIETDDAVRRLIEVSVD